MKRGPAAGSLVIAVAMTMVFGGTVSAATPRSCPAELPQGSDPVTLDPADFGGPIDNPYWPMAPKTTWAYKEGRTQRVRISVKSRTKEILGIGATVVHDVVRDRGQLVEDTLDWYAQDRCGTVWYLGEKTAEYEDGVVVSTAGSWEAGVDGAFPGVIVPADPTVGLTYRQEYYAGEAEDAARILSTDERVQVPYGSFRDALLTKDFTPLHPKMLEYKLYAKGVGPVLVLGVSKGSQREELIRFSAPTP
ncbi:MAG: hypothetical protein ABWZ53_01730 [Actinomycetota bacterium]